MTQQIEYDWHAHKMSYLQSTVAMQKQQLENQQLEIDQLKRALINMQSVVNGMLQREL